jgi:hypothetical protein
MNMRFALLVSTAMAPALPAWADDMPMKGAARLVAKGQ